MWFGTMTPNEKAAVAKVVEIFNFALPPAFCQYNVTVAQPEDRLKQ